MNESNYYVLVYYYVLVIVLSVSNKVLLQSKYARCGTATTYYEVRSHYQSDYTDSKNSYYYYVVVVLVLCSTTYVVLRISTSTDFS